MKTHYSTSPPTRRNRARLGVETLEGREVPATLLDLSTAGSQVTASGAILQQTAPVATGDFHTFLSLQRTSMEQGYNTDARPFQLDQVGNLTVTHSLLLSDVPTVTISGTVYREFVLDVGQTSKKPLIILEDLRIYLGSVGNLTGYNSKTRTLAGLTAIFNMDAAQDYSVKLNGALNGTSGQGDAFVLIPDSVFTGGGTYVYLYSKFSGTNNGVESWGVRPLPGTASISGNVFADINGDGTWEPNDPFQPEPGVNGYSILLERLDGANWVTVETKTAQNGGSYSFTGLTAGTYRITKISDPVLDQQLELQDGWNTVGSAGGMDENFHGVGDNGLPDRITNIMLSDGVSATGYNWAMLPNPGGGGT